MPVVPPLQETTQLYRQQRNMSPGLGNTWVEKQGCFVRFEKWRTVSFYERSSFFVRGEHCCSQNWNPSSVLSWRCSLSLAK
jgi:hypothetical protein